MLTQVRDERCREAQTSRLNAIPETLDQDLLFFRQVARVGDGSCQEKVEDKVRLARALTQVNMSPEFRELTAARADQSFPRHFLSQPLKRARRVNVKIMRSMVARGHLRSNLGYHDSAETRFTTKRSLAVL